MEDEVRDNLTPEETGEPEDEGGEGEDAVPEESRGWAPDARQPGESLFVETGRGQAVEVQVGAPFTATIERIAEEAHYGGYFRVFLNGSELVEPENAPEKIEPGMRIAITSYDKVG